MAAAALDLTIEQGVTFGATCTVRDATGTVVNLTGYTIRGKIKVSAQDVSAVEEFTCTITDAANGVFTFGLSASETAALAATGARYDDYTSLVYDLEMVSGAGVVTRVLNGSVLLSPEVTD